MPRRVRKAGAGQRKRIHRGALAGCAAAMLALALATGANAATTVWAVGDGAVPGGEDDALAALVASRDVDRFLYLGDVYENGTAEEFALNYHPSWGRFKAITHPTPGNHEWDRRAEGYDPYWGPLAPRAPGGGRYYSVDLRGWHLVSLNSHEDSGPGSAQARWLARDLRGYDGTCTIAFHHRPRYTAGANRDASDLEPLYRLLAGNAVALLSGHDHNYQRLRPERGLVQFIVGTGGRLPLYPVNGLDPRLAAYDDAHLGALALVLESKRAHFRFVRADGSDVDSGALGCTPHRPRLAFSSPGTGPHPRVVSLAGTARVARGPVRLTLLRERGRRCSAFDGRRFRPAACRSRRAVRATGVRRWRYRLPRPLAPGRYLAVGRVSGYGGHEVVKRLRFRVR